MKKFRILTALTLGLLVVGGTSALAIHENEDNVIRSEALAETTLPENVNGAEPTNELPFNLYINLVDSIDTWWFNDEAVTFVRYMDGNEEKWTEPVTIIKKYSLLATNIPLQSASKLIVVRCSKGTQFGNWNSKVNQTLEGGLDFDASKITDSKCVKIKVDNNSWDQKNIYVDQYSYQPEGLLTTGKFYLNSLSDVDAKDKDGVSTGHKLNWAVDEAKLGAYFFNGSNGAFTNNFMTKATGKFAGINNLYECDIPTLNGKATNWDGVILLRYNKVATELNWSNLWNRTDNIVLNNNDCRLIRPSAHDKWQDDIEYFKAEVNDIDHLNNLATWVENFLSTTSTYCDITGKTHDEIQSQWATLSTSYKALGPVAARYFKENVTPIMEGGSKIQRAAALYDLIMNNYSANKAFDDFAGRHPTKESGVGLFNLDDTSYITTIVIVSALAITSIAVISFLVARKKRLAK